MSFCNEDEGVMHLVPLDWGLNYPFSHFWYEIFLMSVAFSSQDAVDTATKENAPADDAADGNSLQTHPDDEGAHSYFMSTKGPPPPPATP